MFRLFGSALLLAFLLPSVPAAADRIVPAEVPTVDEAVSMLEDGDRIVLLPGEYRVFVEPPRGIDFSMVGRGGRDSTFLKGLRQGDPIVFAQGEGERCVLRGITFDRSDAPQMFAVLASGRRIAIEDCRFIAGAGARIDSCTGVVRRSEFRGCFDGLQLRGSPVLVEESEFVAAGQYGILARGSEAKIVRNVFREVGHACVLVVGKRRAPVIGGSRANGNVFLLSKM
ncbi:MAG: right-handed parallel beta-helix repeat-containing protein, partial [Candidatus Eisenbacteria bacterium]